MLLVSMKSKTVFQTDTLYSCLLSLVSLSLVSFSLVSFSLTHSYRRIHICFIATENSSVFNLCCTELMQHNHIHSIRWPFTHPFTCKHIHIQLTIHSYHRHMLSYHYTLNLFHNLSSISDCSPVLQLSNHLCYNYRTASPRKLISNLFPRTKQMPPASNENAELLVLRSCW